MGGRPLVNDESALTGRYTTPESAKRRRVLRETLERFATCPEGDRYLSLARKNLERWNRNAPADRKSNEVLVLPGDWGVVTLKLTKEFGTCFAVLNMANAYVPGGAYVEGAVAQEENMYRRTDCHFYIGPPLYDAGRDRYTPEATRLLSGEDGVVYLDSTHPRICDVFDPSIARRQIRAQFATLKAARIRHVIFGAFGCGAFRNPADEVARIYREAIIDHRKEFDVIAFAIFDAGYGPDNYSPFKAALDGI